MIEDDEDVLMFKLAIDAIQKLNQEDLVKIKIETKLDKKKREN